MLTKKIIFRIFSLIHRQTGRKIEQFIPDNDKTNLNFQIKMHIDVLWLPYPFRSFLYKLLFHSYTFP